MKLISWNVNGIRAALKKGLSTFLTEHQPDILCLQETKARPEQVDLPFEFSDYHAYWNSAVKPGYSGTAIFTREKPLNVIYGLDIEEHDQEGRVITAEYESFYLVTVYTPNSKSELERLDYRQEWDRDFLQFMLKLEATKPVIFCGDLNVSHQPIDLARPDANRRSAGYSDEERAGFSAFLENGFFDSFRFLYPEKKEAYSWWSYRGGARARNVGWRLDYFCLSESLKPQLKSAQILASVMGSDHCPVEIELHSN